MKRLIILVAACLLVAAFGCGLERAIAGTVEQIKEGSKEAVSEIKDGVVKTGKAIAETGKDVKEGSQKGWSGFKEDAVKAGTEVKESAKEVGKDIKKAFHETKETVKKEFTGEAMESSKP